MGSGTLPEITVCEHSSLCHPQMQVKAPSCKEEATRERGPETHTIFSGQKLFQNSVKQSGNFLGFDQFFYSVLKSWTLSAPVVMLRIYSFNLIS